MHNIDNSSHLLNHCAWRKAKYITECDSTYEVWKERESFNMHGCLGLWVYNILLIIDLYVITAK